MYNFKKIEIFQYIFETSAGSKYSVLFNQDGQNSVEIGLSKDIDNGDESSDVFNIMSTVTSITSNYLNDKNINTINLNVIGSSQNEIDQKIILYNKYYKDLPGNWKSSRTGNLLKLTK